MNCPFAKSDMTPCVRRDGPVAYAMDSNDNPICVGCEKTPERTGVARPADWEQTVAAFKRKARRR